MLADAAGGGGRDGARGGGAGGGAGGAPQQPGAAAGRARGAGGQDPGVVAGCAPLISPLAAIYWCPVPNCGEWWQDVCFLPLTLPVDLCVHMAAVHNAVRRLPESSGVYVSAQCSSVPLGNGSSYAICHSTCASLLQRWHLAHEMLTQHSGFTCDTPIVVQPGRARQQWLSNSARRSRPRCTGPGQSPAAAGGPGLGLGWACLHCTC